MSPDMCPDLICNIDAEDSFYVFLEYKQPNVDKEFAKRWQKAKDGINSTNPLDVPFFLLQSKVFERLWSYKMNNHYSDKENALTLVYFNNGVHI